MVVYNYAPSISTLLARTHGRDVPRSHEQNRMNCRSRVRQCHLIDDKIVPMQKALTSFMSVDIARKIGCSESKESRKSEHVHVTNTKVFALS